MAADTPKVSPDPGFVQEWNYRASLPTSERGSAIGSEEFQDLVEEFKTQGVPEQTTPQEYQGEDYLFGLHETWPDGFSFDYKDWKGPREYGIRHGDIIHLARIEAMKSCPYLNQELDISQMKLRSEYISGACGYGTDVYVLESQGVVIRVEYKPIQNCVPDSRDRFVFSAYENGRYRHLSQTQKEQLYQRLENEPSLITLRERPPRDINNYLNDWPESRTAVEFLDQETDDSQTYEKVSDLWRRARLFYDPAHRSESGFVTEQEYLLTKYNLALREQIRDENIPAETRGRPIDRTRLYKAGDLVGKTPGQVDADLEQMRAQKQKEGASDRLRQILTQLTDYSIPFGSIKSIDSRYVQLEQIRGQYPDLFNGVNVPNKAQVCRDHFNAFLEKQIIPLTNINEDFLAMGLSGGINKQAASRQIAQRILPDILTDLQSQTTGNAVIYDLEHLLRIMSFCDATTFRNNTFFQEIVDCVKQKKATEEAKTSKYQAAIDAYQSFLSAVE